MHIFYALHQVLSQAISEAIALIDDGLPPGTTGIISGKGNEEINGSSVLACFQEQLTIKINNNIFFLRIFEEVRLKLDAVSTYLP